MATTITIPDGYNLQMLPNGQFQIVPNDIQQQETYSNTNDYHQQHNTNNNYGKYNEFNQTKKPTLSREERQLLEFCASVDMREFIREEFEKHPLIWEDGILKKGW